MDNYIRPIKFFCQKTLPLVYDESLSYYEAICKIVNKVNEIIENVGQYGIKIADPIEWDITSQYPLYTLVIDSEGTAYISNQPVPVGITLDNTEYWIPVFNYGANINQLRAQIASNERDNTNASKAYNEGDLLFSKGVLYKATTNIAVGTLLIPDTNIEHITVEEYIDAIASEVEQSIDTIGDEVSELQTGLAQEIIDRENNYRELSGDLADETANRENNYRELVTIINNEASARQSADATLNIKINTESVNRRIADSDLQTAINNVASDSRSEYNNLQAQINEFVALTPGSTTGDAELVNIRVGYNGEIYKIAGNAVRSQAIDIHRALDFEKYIISHNVLNTMGTGGHIVSEYNNAIFYVGCGRKLFSFGRNNVTLSIEFQDNSDDTGIVYRFIYADGSQSSDTYTPRVMYNKVNIPNYADIVGIKLTVYSAASDSPITKFGIYFNAQPLDNYVEVSHSWEIDKLVYADYNYITPVDFTVEAGVLSTGGEYNTGYAEFVHAMIPVKEGETYIISGYSFPSAIYPAYVFTNLESPVGTADVVAYGTAGLDEVIETKLLVPKNARYLVVNTYTDVTPITIHKCGITTTDTNETYKSNLNGKKIVWFGTSIPDDGGDNCYPLQVGKMLGATVYNASIGSSEVRGGVHSAITVDDPMGWSAMSAPGLLLSMSLSSLEKAEIMSAWDTKWKYIVTWYGDRVDIPNKRADYLNSSWDILINKYLRTGDIGECDLYVFDHGYNDGAYELGFTDLSDMPTDMNDRTYWLGAMSFCFKKILNSNPRAKIVIIGHYSNSQNEGTNFDTKYVCEAQEKLANIWGMNIVKTWEGVCLTSQTVVVDNLEVPLYQVLIPDGIHPSTDTTGKTLKMLAEKIASVLKDM